MAGWVFADLLLVLFIIGLGSQITAIAKPTPPPAPSAIPTPTPTPPKPPSMQLNPVTVSIPTDPGALLSSDPAISGPAKLSLAAAIADQTAPIAGQRAAMVLVWGHASQTSTGIALARAGIEADRVARPETFGQSVQKDLWAYDAQDGVIEFEIYLFQ